MTSAMAWQYARPAYHECIRKQEEKPEAGIHYTASIKIQRRENIIRRTLFKPFQFGFSENLAGRSLDSLSKTVSSMATQYQLITESTADPAFLSSQ